MITFTCENTDGPSLVRHFIQAGTFVKEGGLIVYPTDTLYGMGTSIYSEKGIKQIFTVKKRPHELPISVAVGSTEDIEKLTLPTDAKTRNLIEELLPGKITIILPASGAVSPLLMGGKNTIGIRMPDDQFCKMLLDRTGPLTSTSVNVHGRPPLLLSSDIKSSRIVKNFHMQIISRKLDKKLLERAGVSGSTIIAINKGNISLLRVGEMTRETIEKIGARHHFGVD